ncbi:MAG: hypothetical protein JWO08_3459 [Verrucomicrobiaceae bacterium]|nr:hypothetical protein [Verrucomicrobiaceae bacterium]
MLWMALLLILGFTGISTRLYWLQVRMHDKLTAEAARLRQDRLPLPALRGSIWDSNGQLLAQDRTLTEIYADKKHLEDAKVVMPQLARIMQITKTALRQQMTDAQIVDAYRGHVVKVIAPKLNVPQAEVMKSLQPGDLKSPTLLNGLEKEESEAWRALLRDNQITGVYLRPYVRRFNPAGDRLAHVLGMVNRQELKGVDGVEKLMNSTLKGVDGYEWVERDSKKKHELPGFAGEVQEPKHGKGVVLTIDMHLQQQLEDILLRAYELHHPKKIQAVLVDPMSGSILAMASQPLEQKNKDGNMERRNMAVTDLYEPGSTMKIITLSAAMDMGKVTLDTTIDCSPNARDERYEEMGGKIWLKDDEVNGKLSVKNVFVHSSNIGAYKIAKLVTEEHFYEYLKRFGFGSKTALGLPREAAGFVHPLDKWSGTSLSRIAMGYEVSVTPLQMAMAVSTIANKGTLMKPRLVDRIVSADGTHMEIQAPQAVRQVCSARTATRFTEAMEAVVTEGTGKQAAIPGVRVAGKTGTAQRFDPRTKNYPKGHFVVSFVGFAPAEDPKVTCVVVMDDPQAEDRKQLYGGKLAAPVFAEVVKSTLDHLAVAPDRSMKISFVPPENTK